MPGQTNGPYNKAGIQGPSSCIYRKLFGKHITKNSEVREQETQAPHDVDVAVVFLELAEEIAKGLCKNHGHAWPKHPYFAVVFDYGYHLILLFFI